MANTNKKPKWNLSECNWENEITTDFPKIIVIKSLEETTLAKLSLFLIEKIISCTGNPQTEKIRSANLLVEVDNKKQAENLIRMKNLPQFEVQR